ncbi:type VI secretion system Vgr family protein [Chitinibacteraceae bacterium HSL-7]
MSWPALCRPTVVRSAHGVPISSEAKPGASGNQLDRDEAQSGVDSAFGFAINLAEVVTNQLADTMETGDGDATIAPDNAKGPKQTQGHLHHLQHALDLPPPREPLIS